MKKPLIASVALVTLLVAPAIAADLPPAYKAPPPVAVYSWTGWYVGGHAGFGWNKKDVTFFPVALDGLPTLFSAGSVPGLVTTDPRGFVGGLQLGYNYQTGRAVFGVEADFSFSDIRGIGSVVRPPQPGGVLDPLITSAEQKLNWFGTLRGRMGFTPFDRSLLYITGGLAYGRTTLATSIVDPTVPCGPFGFCPARSTTQWRTGWTIGGGWEYALAPNWSTKLEYLYYDLGTVSHSFNDPLSTFPGFIAGASAQFKGHIVRAGLNYRFDWSGPVSAKY